MTPDFDTPPISTSAASGPRGYVLSLVATVTLVYTAAAAAETEPKLLKQRQQATARLSEEVSQRVGLPSLLSIVENYDLSWRSRLARSTTLREEPFKRFVTSKGLDMAILSEGSLDELVLEYWRTTGRVSPEMAAWRALDINKPAWDAAMPHFRTIVQARPSDVPPRILMLATPPRNSNEMAQWFDLVKDAYRVSANDNERLLSVVIPALMAMSLETNSFAAATLKQFSSWLGKIEVTDKDAAFKERIRIARALVAISMGDTDEALANARDTPLFVLMPLWLMSKGQWQRALDITREAKNHSALSPDDKTMLNAFEGILPDLVQSSDKKEKNDSK